MYSLQGNEVQHQIAHTDVAYIGVSDNHRAGVSSLNTMTFPARYSRRAFIGGLAVTASGAIAGCLGQDDDPTVLSPGELSPAEGAGIPRNGDELPSVQVKSPLHERTVSTDAFVGERHVLLTYVFTRCTMACPLLAAALAMVQADAIASGYEDDIVCMPITFDPGYDDDEQLRTFSDAVGADPDRESWHFLRPDDPTHAEEIVTGNFGIEFRETEPEDEIDMPFMHTSAITLANVDGIVERTYAGRVPETTTVLDDTLEVVQAFE